DSIVSHEQADLLRDEYHSLQVLKLGRSNHFPFLDQSNTFNQLMKDFFDNGRPQDYSFSQQPWIRLGQLVPAYATPSQGGGRTEVDAQRQHLDNRSSTGTSLSKTGGHKGGDDEPKSLSDKNNEGAGREELEDSTSSSATASQPNTPEYVDDRMINVWIPD